MKDEIVMLGGHMDSWHSGTGATDNGAGVAVAMEAARILMALGLKPRRTIRVGLWSGEEQGLFGSSNYVKQHFGEMKGGGNIFGIPQPDAPKPELVKGSDYDKLSAYYNLDNGTGKIRGVYLQGNSAVAPIFRAWLSPFGEIGASTLSLSNTGWQSCGSISGMSITIELPPDVEKRLAALPDLDQRVADFLRGQAELEQWRERRYSAKVREIVRESLAEAEEAKARGVSREEAFREFFEVYDRITAAL